MLFFLHGEDIFRVNERQSVFQKTFAKKYPQAEFFVFDFEDEGSPDGVKRGLASCEEGLFATQKMVTFLHPFVLGQPQEKHLLDFLERFIKKTDTEVALLFVNPGKIKKTHPLAKFLAKYADKEEIIERLEEKNIAAYVKRELAIIDAQARFSPLALELFILSLGVATQNIRTELQKLSTFKPGGVFETEDIRLFVGSAKEVVIFEALDSLGRGDKKRALLLFHREAVGSEGAYPLLSMCAWQARRLLLVREMFDHGIRRTGDIAAQTKLPPFAVQKMLGTINNFSLQRIKNGLSLLSQFDAQLKVGTMDPLVALDLFIWKF
jgi:DNA polymerase III delta subunit